MPYPEGHATGITRSELNSTVAPLAAGGTFTGEWEYIAKFQEISLNLAGAPTNAPGTFYFELSPDGVYADVSIPYSLPGPGFVPQFLRVVLPYFRVRYKNGPTPQTAFRCTTIYHLYGAARLTRFLTQVMDQTEPVEVTRSVIAGARPDATYGNVPVTRENFLSVAIADTGALAEDTILGADRGIFGSAVTASRIQKVVASWVYPLANNAVSSSTTGTGSVTQGAGQLAISSGTGATASAEAHTDQIVRYVPGREVYEQITAVFTVPTSAASGQRAGLFSITGADALWFGYEGLVFGVASRSSGVDTFVPRTAWNGDPLDSNVNSRFTRNGVPEAINFTFLNIYRIRFGWLGSAPVIFQVLNPDGAWVTFHTIQHSNTSALPTITDPNLRIHMEVTKTAADATDLIMRSGSWDAGNVEDPTGLGPEEMRGNVYRTANLPGAAASAMILAIPTGRQFRLTSLTVFVRNTSAASDGQLDIRDDGVVRLPITFPRGVGAVQGQTQVALTFPTPLRFDTNVNCLIVSGTLVYSITVVGYEVALP